MSAPAKTSDEEILAAAARLIEQHGPDGLAMKDVAEAVGVRTPSLYKRYEDRADLLRALTASLLHQLEEKVRAAAHGRKPVTALRQMAAGYREFAKERPRQYELLFRFDTPNDPGVALRAKASEKLLEVLRELCGDRRALSAARLLVAYLHGFVSMETANAFQFGGDVDESFRFGLETILSSLVNVRR